jgi:GT2 family glycosyltransferase
MSLDRPESSDFADSPHATEARSGRLVSVVVVCAGQLEYTQLCLHSLLKHSRPPCEVVAVDMASLDGTKAFLQGAALAADLPIKVVELGRETDFATAYSAGIERCDGEYVVLLNNDTIVPSLWLNQLAGMADSDPEIGAVGAMSNHAPPAQRVGAISYRIRSLWPGNPGADPLKAARSAVDAVEGFARTWREQHPRQWFEAERLGSFCLLVKRKALDAIGRVLAPSPLGINADDLCARLHRAGYRSAVCKDLFIHHFGTRLAAPMPKPELWVPV